MTLGRKDMLVWIIANPLIKEYLESSKDNSMENGGSMSVGKKEETEFLEGPVNGFQSFSNVNPIFLIFSSLLFLHSWQLLFSSRLLDISKKS